MSNTGVDPSKPPAQEAATLTETSTKDCFSGWERYPEQLPTWNPFCYNTTQLRERLDRQAETLFSDETELHVIDAALKANFKGVGKELQTSAQLEEYFSKDLPDLRIVSIVRKHSLKPLKISKASLLKILHRHQIEPCFLDLLFSFRNVEELSEKGQSFWSPVRSSRASSELCYQLKYMEKNDHRQGVQWSERQIGVYHRFGTTGNDVIIILHAGLNSDAQKRLHNVFKHGQYEQRRHSSPLLLHALIIGTYLDNWRWVLDDCGNQCLEKEGRGFTVSLHHQSLNFKELQTLRNLQSKLLVFSTILETTENTIKDLRLAAIKLATKTIIRDVDESFSEISDGRSIESFDCPELQALQTLELKCKGYVRSTHVLQARADKLIKMLADALSLKSQDATINIADSTYELTQQSVDDNVIVRVITVITLIYLPCQGVATFFGMNLTSLPQPSNKISFANDWWLFLAISLPLTFLTLAVLGVAWLLERSKKLKRQNDRKSSKT